MCPPWGFVPQARKSFCPTRWARTVYVDKDHGFNVRIAHADVRRIALIVGVKRTFDDEVAVHLELVPSGVRVCVFMRYSDVSAFEVATPLEVLSETSTCT